MYQNRVGLMLAAGLCLVAVCVAAPSRGSMHQVAIDTAGHIVVGPNVAVDVHADTPFVEPAIAVDEHNEQHLVGASMYYASTTWTSSAFGSTDGGSTWIASTLPSDL